MNNGISVKLRIIENTTIKAQLIRWNWDSHKQRDQPVWAGLAEERHETPAKNWKSAHERWRSPFVFTAKQTFRELRKGRRRVYVYELLTLSLHSWFGSEEVGCDRLCLGRRSWLSEKSRREVKRLPELQKGKIRQKSKAKGEWEKWQAQGIKINTQT